MSRDVYTALELSAESRIALDVMLIEPAGRPDWWKLRGEHMTIDLKPIEKSMAASFAGQEFELRIVKFGQMLDADGAGVWAIEVETKCPSKNSRKHITLAHGAPFKPMHSNEIPDEAWEPIQSWCNRVGILHLPVLRGTVKELAHVRA